VQERQGYHHGSLHEALLDAGLDLTRSGGVAALTLREVTRRVGVSPNAAYRHFADRDALLRAVAARIQEDMADRMRGFETPVRSAAGSTAGSTADSMADSMADSWASSPAAVRLRAVGLGYIEFALAEPGWFDTAFANVGALLTEDPGAPPPLPLQMLLDALDGLVESGVLPPEQRAGAQWPCWSAVHGFALLALAGPLRSTPREEVWAAAERTVDAIITGVVAGADQR
jgi:AcrR family transcriptional regulator